jgi:O-antigen/teichoic acid export membrane protein
MNVGETPGPAATATAEQNEHLRTDHLRHDLKGRSISGGFVTVSAQAVKFFLTVGSTMVLARLLTPDDFGVVTMVVGTVASLRIFNYAGLSTATVQRDDITHAQVSNLFWINLGLSGAFTLLVAAASPLFVWFFKDPRLLPVSLLISLTFVLNGAAVQHQALLNRQMRFKAIAVIEVVSLAASVVVGVVMAWAKCAYWSLVFSALTAEFVALVLSWRATLWRPQLPRRGIGTLALVGFGANLTLGNFFFSIVRSLDNVLIGRRYGADSVGLYSRATALLIRPLDQIMSPISAVFMPALSRLQDQPERYRRAFGQVNDAMMLFTFPMTAMLLALAHPLTIVLLGRKWTAAAPIFAGFTPAALQAPLSMAVSCLYMSQGRGKDLLVASSIVSPITLLAILAGLPFGPLGVAISFSASGLLLRLPIHYFIVGRRGPVRTKDLWISFLSYTPLWGLVFLGTWAVRRMVPGLSPLWQLATCGAAGSLVAALCVLAVPPWRSAAVNFLKPIAHLLAKRKPFNAAGVLG